MEINLNTFLAIASLVLALYVIFVFILFLPSVGFGIVPIFVLALFGGFAIIGAVFYNNYDGTSDYNSDTVYLSTLAITAIVFFIVIAFVIWFVYTQYSKPIDPIEGGGLDFKEHLEDMTVENMTKTPFSNKS